MLQQQAYGGTCVAWDKSLFSSAFLDPKRPGLNEMRVLGLYMGNCYVVRAEYSLFEALDPERTSAKCSMPDTCVPANVAVLCVLPARMAQEKRAL